MPAGVAGRIGLRKQVAPDPSFHPLPERDPFDFVTGLKYIFGGQKAATVLRAEEGKSGCGLSEKFIDQSLAQRLQGMRHVQASPVLEILGCPPGHRACGAPGDCFRRAGGHGLQSRRRIVL